MNIKVELFEELYDRLNKRQFVHPDPLEHLYSYDSLKDREIAGLVASSLAYGRVAQILKSVASILKVMAPSPFDYVTSCSNREMEEAFAAFKHRFTTGAEMASMLTGVKSVIAGWGSLYNCLRSCDSEKGETIIPALTGMVHIISRASPLSLRFLLPSPEDGSACKRLNLYTRWMIRHDEVDPGGWDGIPPARLIIPLDTHMYRICCAMGFTERSCSTLPTAMEVTGAFRELNPGDPVKYDFALTRLGMRNDLDRAGFLHSLADHG
jgi:uncharacterized protein (TIGR02757 family)